MNVVPRNGSQLHYQVSGRPGGRLVVLTHGDAMDHHLFDLQAPALEEAGYRVLAWDLRGHGESQPLGDGPLTIGTFADDLCALVDEAGATGPVCLVGQSLGGYVSQEVVFSAPERVAALVIIGATCTTLPIRWPAKLALRASPWLLRLWPYGDLRRRIAAAVSTTPAGRAYARAAAGRLAKPEFLAIWRAVARAIHPEPGYRIEQPLLLARGDHDRMGDIAAVAPVWAARDPRCRYRVVPDAGHNANLDNPSAFNRLLLEFLRDVYPAR